MTVYIIVGWNDNLANVAKEYFAVRRSSLVKSSLRLYNSPEISDLGNIIVWDPIMHSVDRIAKEETAMVIPKSLGEMFTDLEILGEIQI